MTFEVWKSDFIGQLEKQGLSKSCVLEIAPLLVNLQAPVTADKNQSEVRKTLKQYLEVAVSNTRVLNGQKMLEQHHAVLERIETTFHVSRFIVVAIWGMETNYGAIKGDTPICAALATLAYNGRRRRLFEDQLAAFCKLIEQGAFDPHNTLGSWAGAMGHTQFMPTSYRDYACSLSGAKHPNILGISPDDALASTANYLKQHGWNEAIPWAIEVNLEAKIDLYSARNSIPITLDGWEKIGVTPKWKDAPNCQYSFRLPAGIGGPAFLISENYNALLGYNNADAYAVAVGHLADRLSGKREFLTKWNIDDRGLTQTEVSEIQNHLTTLGFDTMGSDGFTGPNTIKAVEKYQLDQKIDVDGFLDLPLLDNLRQRIEH